MDPHPPFPTLPIDFGLRSMRKLIWPREKYSNPDFPGITVYKAMKNEHARMLVEEGRLRLSTLRQYQSYESRDTSVGDPNEGRRDIRADIGRFNPLTDHDVGAFLTTAGFLPEQILSPGSNFILAHSSFILRHQHPDCYIFCASHRMTLEMLNRFRETDGYDTVVAFTDLRYFTDLLIEEICRRLIRITSIYAGDIEYTKKIGDRFNSARNHRIPLLKTSPFEWQNEFRIAFESNRDLQPLWPIEIPEYMPYMRIVASSELPTR